MVAAVLFVEPPRSAAAVTPVANPPVAEECGIPVTLVLDASGSIDSSHAVDTVRNAATVFLTALKGTGSTARVIDFGSVARQTAPATLVTGDTLAPGGALANALKAYYNPIPPLQPGVTGHAWNGRTPVTSASNYSNSTAAQYTNWDQSLDLADAQHSDLVVYVTDGDPTAVDSDQPGDPFFVPGKDPPNVRVGMSNGAGLQLALDRAVEEANTLKGAGTRMLAVGVGSAVTQADSVARLTQIAGPQVVRDATTVSDLNQIDVAVVPDFNDLAALLRKVVTALCSPSLTIRKLAQTGESTSYDPAPGWSMTVNPTIVGGGVYRWIQPPGAPVGPQTVVTNANGFANFQWEPTPPSSSSTAAVSEAVQPGFTPGTAHCDVRHPDDTVTSTDFPSSAAFTLGIGPEDIATCTLLNNFVYAPAIALQKVNSPTLVRGDLSPPASVTSTYTVTNPGNATLTGVTVTDDTCGPVDPVPATGTNVGDTDGDGRLDPGEAWRFTCTHPVQQSLTKAPTTVVNTAIVTGSDPRGVVVTDTATADYGVVVPGIHVDKTVGATGVPPADEITVSSGTDVTYHYAVTNTGNVPLQAVTLSDDTAPCTSPTFTGGDTNGDGLLDLTETWTYTCTAPATADVVDTATVTGLPTLVTPTGPAVTDSDQATVNVVLPDLTLTKSVDQHRVLPGTTVTYTYVATNTGTASLRNPDDPIGSPTIPPVHWVTDNKCADVTYVSGDTDDNGLLDPGEAWQFTCQTPISALTVNIATITAVTVAPVPVTLVRHALDVVDVVAPAIAITKTALVGVVLDPSATPVAGPDVPAPRQAVYEYQVSNTGSLPLAGVASRITDDKCSPLTLDPAGDVNHDGLLDEDEVWDFTCATTLTKADGSPPNQTVSSLVTNTAHVTGTPVLDGVQHPEADVAATDTAQVLVIKPSLTLTKTASEDLVRPGDQVTYTYRVTNTGDVGLELLDGGDDICAPITFVGGDTNHNGLVDGANSGAPETWTFTCPQTVDEPLTNHARVVGVDPLGNHYEATAQATVDVLLAGITLDKSVSDDLVMGGTPVTYTFTVTNTGESPLPANDVLSNVTLTDSAVPAQPTCTDPAFTGGDTNSDGLLDRTETWTYTCTATITRTTDDTATVQGTDLKSGVVDAQDTARVTVITPGISVVKSAAPTSVPAGGTVTYTYLVTNTGNVPLTDVASSISDDTCAPVTYVSGDVDGDGRLDTDQDIFESGTKEVWTFRCTTTVTQDTVNTVVVKGTPVDPNDVPLCDPATCAVDGSDVAKVVVTAPEPGVLPTKEGLSPTGAQGLGLGWLSLALLGLGSALVVVARRRPTTSRGRRRI